ncbi:MAG: GTP pyrophosphokinase family protein [Eubacteriales bacterium]|nr:GTP pyrophosphokinase family protein [Eubacteriales bacterium]
MAENTEAGIKETEYPEEIFFEDAGYQNLMMQYKCAILELETKFRVLDTEFSLQYNRNPIENIKTRLKSPHSIVEKMQRKGWDLSVENIEKNLSDVAGVRVICSFPEDIYSLAGMLTRQDDIVVVEIKDYIARPKPNGYRSLHLILGIPIFLSDGKKHMRAEVQFRTIAMDFWASLEHKLKYKQDIENADVIARELKKCADTIGQVDNRMEEIRKMIDVQ